ncbi:hypothetical protein [Xanthocytophaga agilis]|uniref:Uncharacterized protein n=1 Tax=Xanthocytophaga agilis TaxID=3048010 RepID=A0AAE3R4R0_9BACT|nr:hypothetical protein [Xanthocytophaga agilis]MDJ1503616.1 hypothetical protein [Xanthocytophaga agilis]
MGKFEPDVVQLRTVNTSSDSIKKNSSQEIVMDTSSKELIMSSSKSMVLPRKSARQVYSDSLKKDTSMSKSVLSKQKSDSAEQIQRHLEEVHRHFMSSSKTIILSPPSSRKSISDLFKPDTIKNKDIKRK